MRVYHIISRILFVSIMVLLPFSCRKAPELPSNNNEKTIPSVTTCAITNIKYNSAEGGGEVTSDGGATVTARGICWNKTGDPTLLNNLRFTSDSNGTGSFTSSMTELEENTNYFITAYATNERGTAYSAVKSFTTLELKLPSVTTLQVSNITTNSAEAGGEVTSDGNGTVTVRGICWNTNDNPTLQNNLGYTTDGSGTGSFISNMAGLAQNSSYYIGAYATNEKGTAYGEVRTFETPTPCGELTVDYGGQVYHTVLINTQCWMQENLNIGTEIIASQEQTNNSTIEKYCYSDNEANCITYGGLYQWPEMMEYITTQGAKGICPDGWHIPTDVEWATLVTNLGGESVAGGKMKETGTSHWIPPNTDANNSSGFTGLPGGARSIDSLFYYFGENGYFWSSSEFNETNGWRRRLQYNTSDINRLAYKKTSGFSVRCLKDSSQ